MADIEFEGESEFERPSTVTGKQSLLLRLVLSTSLAKTETEANRILLVVACLCTLVALFILFFGSGWPSTSNDTHSRVLFVPTSSGAQLTPGVIPPP